MFCFLGIGFTKPARAQSVFAPPEEKPTFEASRIDSNLSIDGLLEEEAWKLAAPLRHFRQVEPEQGDRVHLDTEVKVVYNDRFLYVGAFCRDTLGRKGIRVPNLRRDFDYGTHDLFGVSIDAFRDERNALVFQTNPYGAQRDLLVIDDQLEDIDWDGLWKVRTSRSDSGWIAEMEIPWATLRYPGPGRQSWGINFYRNARRLNELSAWSLFPRAFSPYRMSYAGVLEELQPPPPKTNIRVQPYLLLDAQRSGTDAYRYEPKAGGEVKWALTSNTVLDATFNTDFAQTDVDRQVVNLSRFSIYFPERRQFFLENASLFSVGWPQNIEPFFSRRIGLDDTGNPIPIDAGLRLTNRTGKKSLGALYIHQRETDDSPAANFAVGRYSLNIGKQNRVGGLVTARWDEATDTLQASYNYTASADGFFRLLPPLSWNVMGSASFSKGNTGNGVAAYSSLRFAPNWIHAYLDQSVVTEEYNPGAGFVSRSNYIATSPGFYLNWRPAWKPSFIRSFEPGAFLNIYHDASDGTLLEREWWFFPVWVRFQDGGVLDIGVKSVFQNLPAPFSPLNIAIGAGTYEYLRYYAKYISDLSKKVSGSISWETGDFYDGHLQNLRLQVNATPVPNIYLSMNYELNKVKNLGADQVSGSYQLFAPEVRLAVNPRLQLSGFYQFNEESDANSWNVRFSWEFQPLSYLYLVFNRNSRELPGGTVATDQNMIGKVTYVMQF